MLLPDPLRAQLDQVAELRGRLHRHLVALSLSEDIIAESCERLAAERGDEAIAELASAIAFDSAASRALADRLAIDVTDLDQAATANDSEKSLTESVQKLSIPNPAARNSS